MYHYFITNLLVPIPSLQPYSEWIGHTAGILVLISLLMHSRIKLRWINLLGSLVFCLYGYVVDAPAVLITNIGISIINVYYIRKVAIEKVDYKLISTESSSEYLRYFMEVHISDIQKIFGKTSVSIESNEFYYMLCGNQIAGIIVGFQEEDEFHLVMDYVLKEYRDFNITRHFYLEDTSFLMNKGIKKLVTTAKSAFHKKYLMKLCFIKIGEYFTLELN